MDFYRHWIEGRRCDPGRYVYLDFMRECHEVAKINDQRVPYTRTVEAITTAVCHLRNPPPLDDWRLWATLDKLGLTESWVQDQLDRQILATKSDLDLVTMLNPRTLDRIRRTPEYDFSMEFCCVSEQTLREYTSAELAGSLCPGFQDSTVGAWMGACAPKRHQYGEVLRAQRPLPS